MPPRALCPIWVRLNARLKKPCAARHRMAPACTEMAWSALCPAPACSAPQGDSLMLKMVAGGPWTTWRMKPVNPGDYELANGAAITLQIEGRTFPLPKCGDGLNAPACPSFLGAFAGCANTALSTIASNTTAARFALEKVNGTTDQYYIRTAGRGSCAKRYLGAMYKTNNRGCGAAQLGLHAKDATDVHTRWQIIHVPALPPCPSPPPPPSPPSPPPPFVCKNIAETCTGDSDCCPQPPMGVACSTFTNTCGFT